MSVRRMLLCTSEVAQLSEVVVQACAGRLRLQQRGCREVRCTSEVAALVWQVQTAPHLLVGLQRVAAGFDASMSC